MGVLLVPAIIKVAMGFLGVVGGSPLVVYDIPGAVSFFVIGPLSAGAFIALIWRMVGSRDCGPLEKNPLASMFFGLRFFVPYFFYVFTLAGLAVLCFLPALLVFFAYYPAESSEPFSVGSLSPGAWAVIGLAVIAGAFSALRFFLRWCIALFIAIAEGAGLSDALKASSRFTRRHPRPLVPFFLLAFTVLMVLPIFQGELVRYIAGPSSDGDLAVSASHLLLYFVSYIFATIMTAAAGAAVYFAYKRREVG